jgi:hypothetical protein
VAGTDGRGKVQAYAGAVVCTDFPNSFSADPKP